MAPITIKKHRLEDEIVFEVDDFDAYVDALITTGIESPKAKYRISIPWSIAEDMLGSNIDIDQQVALFFRLGPASGIEYQIVDQR
jgi:hypothetical protein